MTKIVFFHFPACWTTPNAKINVANGFPANKNPPDERILILSPKKNHFVSKYANFPIKIVENAKYTFLIFSTSIFRI